MSSWWDLSDGSDYSQEAAYEAVTSFEPVPVGVYKAAIADIKWAYPDYEPEGFISVQWVILSQDEYKGRMIFQKIRCNSSEDKKSDKARRMLYAIDRAAGGKLPMDKGPDDLSLKSLTSLIMHIRAEIWENEGKTGNWVSAVSKDAVKQAPVAQPEGDEDIPF